MKIMRRKFVALCTPIMLLSICLIASSFSVQAGIALERTRLVIAGGEHARPLTLKNDGDEVYLVQVGVRTWDGQKADEIFRVQPPLFRLESRGSNLLRVVYSGKPLPQDRESIFRLELNAIPSGTPEEAAESIRGRVSASLGVGIKLFYRPEGVPKSSEVSWGKLTFASKEGQVMMQNPSPFYLTLAELNIVDRTIAFGPDGQQQMIAPFGKISYAIKAPAGAKVNWKIISDYGGLSPRQEGRVE